jgi:heme/copper-type cytochrome/quinol oxidase subunit 2
MLRKRLTIAEAENLPDTNRFSKRIPAGALAALCLALAVTSSPVHAETVTLPVAVSAVGRGGVPFVSDVRVFNTSYTDVLAVTAIFRFNGQQASFQLEPRGARAFDDICASLFGAPASLGAIDFLTNGAPDQLVVTSQLRSPAADGGHVGMFVPGLPQSAAHPVTALTGLVNGDSRTNIGVYNPNPVAITATVSLFDGPVLLGTVPVSLGPHAVNQYNDIYKAVGFESLVRTDGYATVENDDPQSPLFTYAAEADNASGDLILVVGSEDVAAPAGFHPPTPVATAPLPTVTPTPPPPTPTPTPTAGAAIVVNLVATQFQWNFNGGGASFVMHVGQAYELHISDGDRSGTIAHGFGGVPGLGLPARLLQAGGPAVVMTFTPNASQTGTFLFACDQSACGTGHSNMLASIQVTP